MPLRASFRIVLGSDPIRGKFGAGAVIFRGARGLSKKGDRRPTLLASVDSAIEFCDGAVYRYFAVPAAIHNALLAADSKGAYFNRKIRNCFRINQVALGWQPAASSQPAPQARLEL